MTKEIDLHERVAAELQPIGMIVVKDGGLFVAQCLEVDVAAQGRTEEEAMRRLRAVHRAEVEAAKEKGVDISSIGPAPAPQ